MQNLITNKVTISSLPITPEAYNFHCTNGLSSLTVGVDQIWIDGQTYSGLPGVDPTDQTFNTLDSLNLKGTEAVLLRFEGLPGNTSSAVEIKYIYHFEGTPAVTINTVLTSATQPIVAMDMQKVERVRSSSIINDAIRILPAYLTTGMQGYAQGGTVGALASMFAKMGL